MDTKANLNNDIPGMICDKDLTIENKILKLKLEETNKENTFLKGEAKDRTVLLNPKIQTSYYYFNSYTKECLL